MKCLHDRNMRGCTRVVCSRRNQGKRVVKMDYVGLCLRDDRFHLTVTVPSPGSSQWECSFAAEIVVKDFVVIAVVLDHLVSMLDEQLMLATENLVFATRQLIPVVNEQYFHSERVAIVPVEGRWPK